jgi:tetratricopeptide (TPR) repeat protein
VLDQSQVDLIRQHLRPEDSDVYIEVDQEAMMPESFLPESGESDSATTDLNSDLILITSDGDAPPTTDAITINLDDLNLDNITDDAQSDFMQQGVDGHQLGDVEDTTIQAFADDPIGGSHASPADDTITINPDDLNLDNITDDAQSDFMQQGIALCQQGEIEGAIQAFQKELEVNPNNATACNNLGFIYYQQQRWEESVAACQKAVALKSDYAEAYWNLSFAYEQIGQYVEAAAAIEKGIELSPGNPDIYSNLGNMYAQLERYEDAANAFQNAILTNPEDAIAYNNLGVVRFKIGDFEGAVEAFRRSVEISPQYEEAKRNLEMALSRVDPLDGLRIEI